MGIDAHFAAVWGALKYVAENREGMIYDQIESCIVYILPFGGPDPTRPSYAEVFPRGGKFRPRERVRRWHISRKVTGKIGPAGTGN